MRISAVAVCFLMIKLTVFIECYETEALPKRFLRTGRSLNPIEAIKNLLPERNVKTVVKLVPPPPGIHPLWKYDKHHGLIPVAINGNLDHLPIYTTQEELEPPPTEYDPPYYHHPQPFEPREPAYSAPQSVVGNFPQYEAPTTEYGIPQEVYVPVNEYGPPNETPDYQPVIMNSNSGEINDGNSGIEMNDALNALDAFGPLLDFLPDPSSDKNNGNSAGIDLGALLKVVSSLPEGSIEKLKALLGIYHAKNNQERLKNLFDAKNATLKLKSGALNSLNNFVQDTYKDHSNKTSSSVSSAPHGIFRNPFSNGILNFPSHNHNTNNPFSRFLGGLFSRRNKAPSNLANSILKRFQNHPLLYIQGIPISGLLQEDKPNETVEGSSNGVNSGGNSLRNILFGNYGDFTDTAIDSSIYKIVPNDYSENHGISSIFPASYDSSSLASTPFFRDDVKDAKVPKIPFVFKSKLNSNPPAKSLGPYVRVSFPKPVKSYSLPYSTPVMSQNINSPNLASTVYTLPSQENSLQFNSGQSYVVPSSTSVNSYSGSGKHKFSVSQDDANSFQPSSSYGVPDITNPVYGVSEVNVNPLFNEVNSILPSPYEEPNNSLNHNSNSENDYYIPFNSYNASNDISVAASERVEQEVKPLEQHISGYSRVSLQNSQGNAARNSSQTPEEKDDDQHD